jgi:hypothetical protein
MSAFIVLGVARWGNPTLLQRSNVLQNPSGQALMIEMQLRLDHAIVLLCD